MEGRSSSSSEETGPRCAVVPRVGLERASKNAMFALVRLNLSLLGRSASTSAGGCASESIGRSGEDGQSGQEEQAPRRMR